MHLRPMIFFFWKGPSDVSFVLLFLEGGELFVVSFFFSIKIGHG